MSGDKRRRLEGVIPDILKRAVELGVEKATEAPDSIKQFMSDRNVPKEVAQVVITQIEDTKNGILRVVANELRAFLEQTNLAADLQKILTSTQFEINTTIRFKPAESSPAGDDSAPESDPGPLPKPEVKTDVFVSKREKRRGR